uniref:DUF4220 domain-containing protein n=1 Tax=Oryza nivara TaxID=4536 RepID=A0A0E0HK46_ORYNI
MDYFNGTDAHCGGAVGAMGSYVYNLTSSYADQKNEVNIVATSLAMLLLAALLLAFDLLAGAATLRPAARLVLSVSLALFLPVTSYLFSEAKNDVPGAAAADAELPLRARLILAWMLLVELLRKKVEATVTGTKGAGGGGPASRAGRVAFLGYLVFFNVHGAGRKAVFGVLWRRPRRDDELMTSCKYAVTGEENLEREAGPNGYLVDLNKTVAGDDNADDAVVVTVGRVWSLAESDQLLVSNPKLKRLCLSYALFKLLRREFEETPLTAAEAADCRELIFRGLCNEGGAAADRAATLFQVFDDELGFVTEYYHSVLPVMLASPFFLLVNYTVFPVLVLGLCLMTVVLCGNGDIAFIAGSIKRDNYAVSFGLLRMTRCLLSRVLRSPSALFSSIDLSITFLLFLTILYEEAWELAVFLLSNWLTVSMVSDYAVKPPSLLRRAAIRGVQWVTHRMSRRNLRVKQYSVLWFCRLPLKLPAAAVPEEAKHSIVEYLAAYDAAVAPLSAGRSAVARNALRNASRLISSACESGSVAEVILTWHIATSLLEVRCPPQAEEAAETATRSSTVATRLSRYCAYLVAFRREMLPDDVDCTARVYGAMTTELKRELGLKGYYFSTDATRYGKMMAIAGGQEDDDESAAEETTVVRKGARLGKALMDEAAGGDEAAVWKLVADVWTEIVVYVAPARDAEQVRAHGEALARGGEFVTVLWALVTHTGIARPAASSV